MHNFRGYVLEYNLARPTALTLSLILLKAEVTSRGIKVDGGRTSMEERSIREASCLQGSEGQSVHQTEPST